MSETDVSDMPTSTFIPGAGPGGTDYSSGVSRDAPAPNQAAAQPVSDFATALGQEDPLLGTVERSIEAQDEPRAKAYEAQAQRHLERVQAYDQQVADVAERMSIQVQREGEQASKWLDQTPNHQGIAAANMHIAPILSVLTAIAGKATGVSAEAMLGGTIGIMQGINQGNEQLYQTSLEKWKAGYEKFQQQAKTQEQYFNLQLKSYAGRADAQEKAAERAERMAGNVRTEEQRKLMTAAQAQRAQDSMALRLQQLEVSRQGLELRRMQLGLMGGMGGDGQSALMTADGKNPYQVLWDIDAAGIKLQGGRGERLIAIAGGMRSHPDWTSAQLVDDAREGRLGMMAAEKETAALAHRVALQAPTLHTMVRPGGILDQMETASKNLEDTGWGDNIVAQKVRKFWNNEGNAEPVVQTYITKLKILQGLEANLISRSGQATDMTRAMAAEEFPEWKGYPALHASLVASREANYAILHGDYDALDEVQLGRPLFQVTQGVSNRAQRSPRGATPAATSARTPKVSEGQTGSYEKPLPLPANPADWQPGQFYRSEHDPKGPVILDDRGMLHHVDPETGANVD